jgi:protein SCO1/2
MLRTGVAALALASVLSAALWQGTSSFRAFTTEGVRRLSVTEQPRSLPNVRLIDMQGRELTLAAEIGRAVVVEFIYTTCPTICVALGESFAKLQDQIWAAGLADRIRLISIKLRSFARWTGSAQRLCASPWRGRTPLDHGAPRE